MVYFLLFLLGGSGYGLLEILWRGYTHWSMMLAGGTSLVLIYTVNLVYYDFNIFLKALMGALIITLIELVFGVIFNLWLKLNIWDYSDRALNVKGQICLLYSFLWFLLCFAVFPICSFIQNKIMT